MKINWHSYEEMVLKERFLASHSREKDVT